MGKIGILTFHRSVNNGAVMQAYSLSNRLAKEYPDMSVEIIDYCTQATAKSYRYTVRDYIKSFSFVGRLKRCLKIVLDPFKIKRLNKRTNVFESALGQLPLSAFSIIDDKTDELFRHINDTYDVLVVGSDAVWNYVSRSFPNAYFPDERVNCSKVSYAASCYGMEFTTYAAKDRQQICNVLDSFSFAGVRDTATEDFVAWSGSRCPVVHTCDPTAFLNIDELPVDVEQLEKKLKKRGFDFERRTIGLMGTDKMCKMIRSMFGKKYQIVALYEYVHGADVNLYDLTPYEWAYMFRYFSLTFTTYFHGTMLSLRNGVPLICIALDTEFAKHHTPKTLDVLGRVGYKDWYFSTDYKGRNYESIKKKAEELLSASLHDEIVSRIDSEAESFSEFKKGLDCILNNGGDGQND